ncbi:MAG: hypothetical protein M3370_02390, partial [Actinomycetota bacterium]|nr:hypothetical protein [Actinomycetota bacterium]
MPLKGRVGLRLAAVLAERGEREEALALVDAEEDAARGREQHGTLGLVLATRARVLRDDRAEEILASAET